MASDALDLVLRLRLLVGLPLHVAWIISAAAGERLDVIDDISRSAVWETRLRHEEPPRCLAPHDVAFSVPGDHAVLPRLPFCGHGLGVCPPLLTVVAAGRFVLLGCIVPGRGGAAFADRKSTRLNSSHLVI